MVRAAAQRAVDGRHARDDAQFANDELRTVRDAMRELNRMVDQLERGESEEYVLAKNGQMRAFVVSVDYFAKPSATARRVDAPSGLTSRRDPAQRRLLQGMEDRAR